MSRRNALSHWFRRCLPPLALRLLEVFTLPTSADLHRKELKASDVRQYIKKGKKKQ